MGCPGTLAGLPTSVGGERIGAVVWAAGYTMPNIVGGTFWQSDAENITMDPAGLQDDADSCSCLCSGIMGGIKMPFFHQVASGGLEDTWDAGYYPGGTTGMYMTTQSSTIWYFNIGQEDRCSKIYAGLYQLHGNRGRRGTSLAGTWTWASRGRLDVTFEHYLFNWCYVGGDSPRPDTWYWWFDSLGNLQSAQHGCHAASNEGGFPFISLCINAGQIGADQGTTCPLSSCINNMDYGTTIPSAPIVGGHNLLPNCPTTSTVWQSCQDSNCSPNGVCQGPPLAKAPTGCISANSPLNDGPLSPTPADNACFDCEGRAIFHPCYNSGTDNTPTWNGNPNVWETPLGFNNTAVYGGVGYGVAHQYGGCETMGVAAPDNLNHPNDYDPFNNPDRPDWYGDYHMQQQNWDNCCDYLQFGCPDPTFANHNGQTGTQNGLDCAGNRDPKQLKFWDGTQWMCEHASWLPFSSPGNISMTYVDNGGTTQTATQPSAGSPVPCTSLTSNSVPNVAGHPYSWNKTNYATADVCCCSDAGCLDNGTGTIGIFGNYGTFIAPPGDRFPGPTVPSYSWASAGGLANAPYYPGYDSMVGSVSPVNLTAPPATASNFCGACTEDCNGDPPGTYAAGWANCCQYQISGCMDDTNNPTGNPDIFGSLTSCGGGPCMVWNYNPLANVDDGSCFVDEPIMGCIDDGGLGLSTTGLPAYGAYFQAGIPANNYNPVANIMDGSCTYDFGCPDLYAQNYDPCADPNNYTAIAAGGPPMCTSSNTTPEWIAANAGAYVTMQIASVPDLSLCVYEIPGAGPGCMDPQAINYNPLATTDCIDNTGTPPYPSDFSCCTYPTEGCTDPNAWNYNALAMIDDGSCEYVIRPFQDEVNFLNGTPVLLCRQPLTKEEALMNVAEPPEIQSEIFIERGKQSVMEPNQRLGEIKTMGGLVNYAYGYYKIKKQE